VATIQQTITEKFLAKLAESPRFEPDRIDGIRSLLRDVKKLKADEIVALLTKIPSDGLK
jgi:hypothetical protein